MSWSTDPEKVNEIPRGLSLECAAYYCKIACYRGMINAIRRVGLRQFMIFQKGDDEELLDGFVSDRCTAAAIVFACI